VLAQVTVTFTAAGTPDDFSPTERNALLQAAARAFGFVAGAPPGSTVLITAASVNIEFIFPNVEAQFAALLTASITGMNAATLQSRITAQLTSPLSIESTGGSLTVLTAPSAALALTAPSVAASSAGIGLAMIALAVGLGVGLPLCCWNLLFQCGCLRIICVLEKVTAGTPPSPPTQGPTKLIVDAASKPVRVTV
jgi:hypothetical protein